MTPQQEIRFCAMDGSRMAMATSGGGPLLVMPTWWASHVERDWARAGFRPHASELVTAGTLAVEMMAAPADLQATSHPHPTLGGALHDAIERLRAPAIA